MLQQISDKVRELVETPEFFLGFCAFVVILVLLLFLSDGRETEKRVKEFFHR